LKYKLEDISLDNLANHLDVEEECQMQENEKGAVCSRILKGAQSRLQW